MAEFTVGTPIETQEPQIEVTFGPDTQLLPGEHRFQLVVVDDAGNQSAPDAVVVVVQDPGPTAVLEAPQAVKFNQPFKLDGSNSSDIADGKIQRYIWTLLG